MGVGYFEVNTMVLKTSTQHHTLDWESGFQKHEQQSFFAGI